MASLVPQRLYESEHDTRRPCICFFVCFDSLNRLIQVNRLIQFIRCSRFVSSPISLFVQTQLLFCYLISFYHLNPNINFIMAETKPQFVSGFDEFDVHVEQHQPKSASPRAVEAARLGLTVLAFLAGAFMVGTAADTLSVFDSTSLSADFYLPLWPVNFDTRPTVALIICGAIILVANAASLAASKTPSVSTYLRYQA